MVGALGKEGRIRWWGEGKGGWEGRKSVCVFGGGEGGGRRKGVCLGGRRCVCGGRGRKVCVWGRERRCVFGGGGEGVCVGEERRCVCGRGGEGEKVCVGEIKKVMSTWGLA